MPICGGGTKWPHRTMPIDPLHGSCRHGAGAPRGVVRPKCRKSGTGMERKMSDGAAHLDRRRFVTTLAILRERHER